MSAEWVPIEMSERDKEYQRFIGLMASLMPAPIRTELGWMFCAPQEAHAQAMPQKLLGCVKIAGLLPPGPCELTEQVYGPSDFSKIQPLLMMLDRLFRW